MTDFTNTTDWKVKDGSTLICCYEHDGQQSETDVEKEPKYLSVELEVISVVDRTRLEFGENDGAESSAGYLATEYISAVGHLIGARIHNFSLEINKTETFSKLDIKIFPTDSDKMQAGRKFNYFGNWSSKDRPEKGWLEGERGKISYSSANKYFNTSSLEASLWLDHNTFNELAQKLKTGENIRKVSLAVLADLYQFGYELYMDLSDDNYGILSEQEGSGRGGSTTARLDTISLEWSPTLTTGSEPVDEGSTEDIKNAESDVILDKDKAESDLYFETKIGQISRDLHSIRANIGSLYLVSILVIALLVFCAFLGWIGI